MESYLKKLKDNLKNSLKLISSDSKSIIKSNTTILSFKTKEGVYIGTDGRVTSGYLLVSDEFPKVFKITKRIYIMTSGSVSIAQLIINYLIKVASEIKDKYGEELDPSSITSFISNILRFNNNYIGLIISGIDLDGSPKIYSVDGDGSVIEENYVTSGSGSLFVYPILDNDYNINLNYENSINLLNKCLNSAKKRDIASGGNSNIIYLNILDFK